MSLILKCFVVLCAVEKSKLMLEKLFTGAKDWIISGWRMYGESPIHLAELL
jgi:hypothetical protein